MELEHEPVNETYMATWFYGLTHEIGHLHSTQKERFPDGHAYSNESIRSAVRIAIERFSYHDELQREALERAERPTSGSVLEIEQIRSEGLADSFACSVLLQATIDIMRELKKPFRIAHFVHEMVIFPHIIGMLERCRRVAKMASMTEADHESIVEFALHPVSLMARGLILRQYLDAAAARFMRGWRAKTRLDNATKFINEAHGQYREASTKIDRGMVRAMVFSLAPERRENEWALIEAFRQQLAKGSAAGLTRREAKQFCDLADTLGADGKLLQAIKEVLGDAAQPVKPNWKGDLLYWVPVVQGPNDFNCPFGLNTKHGYLVFVFAERGELYDAFFGPSSQMLRPGFRLGHGVLPVSHEARIGPELASRMPEGKQFQVIVQGTEEFARYMQELADDTIWED